MNRARSVVVSAVAAALFTSTALCQAQPSGAAKPAPSSSSGDEKAAAEALYVEAQKLIAAGRYVDACPKLEESQRRDPGIGTMLYLADCYEKVGRIASAWAEFREAEDLCHKENDLDRAAVAKRHADALEPRLARLTIKIAPENDVPGLLIKRDEKELGPAERNVPIPVDPGKHSITVTAPNKKRWERAITIVDAPANSDMIVPPLENAPEPPPPVKPESPVVVVEEPNKGGTQRVIGLVVGGAGVAGIAVGSVLGIAAKSKYDESSTHCQNNFCDPTGTQQRHDAFGTATASTVLWIAGGALIAGGAVIYFTAPKTKVVTATIAPAPNGATGAVRVAF